MSSLIWRVFRQQRKQDQSVNQGICLEKDPTLEITPPLVVGGFWIVGRFFFQAFRCWQMGDPMGEGIYVEKIWGKSREGAKKNDKKLQEVLSEAPVLWSCLGTPYESIGTKISVPGAFFTLLSRPFPFLFYENTIYPDIHNELHFGSHLLKISDSKWPDRPKVYNACNQSDQKKLLERRPGKVL